jgi:hypothetical protein
VDYGAGLTPFSLGLADLDRDGRPDIAVTNPSDRGGTVTLLLNQGGTFPQRDLPAYSTGLGSGALVLGDLNGDGKIDMAVANLGIVDDKNPELNQPGSVTIYLNTSP